MKIKILAPLLIIAIFTACSKESNNHQKRGTMSISTRTATSSEDNFENDATFRLAVYDAGTTHPYLADDFVHIYNYIKATKSDGVWGYSFDGGVTSGSSFGYIVDELSPKSVDFVAASPYIINHDLSAVPFSVPTLKGYMWAKTEGVILDNTSIITSLSFSHIMSALQFSFTLKHNVNGVTLDAITVKLLDSNGNLKDAIVSSGMIDFNDGTITPSGVYGGNYTISNSTPFEALISDDGTTEYRKLKKSIYFPPFEMNETDTLKIGFKFNTVEIAESITLPGSDFAVGDDTFGMERGYRYNLNIELDNYLKFSGEITKDNTWIDADETIHTEI